MSLLDDVRRRLLRLGWASGAGAAVVLFVSVGFLIPVFIDPADRVQLGLVNGPLIAAYIVVAGVLITRHMDRHLARTLEWVVQERAPDEREHRQTLRLALHNTKVAAVPWIVGGLVFSVLNAVIHSWALPVWWRRRHGSVARRRAR